MELLTTTIASEAELTDSFAAIRRFGSFLGLDRIAIARLQAFVMRAWLLRPESSRLCLALRVQAAAPSIAIGIEVRTAQPRDEEIFSSEDFRFFSGRVTCERTGEEVVLAGLMDAPDLLVEKISSGQTEELKAGVARIAGRDEPEELRNDGVFSRELCESVRATAELLAAGEQLRTEIDSLKTELEDANREIAYLREEVEALTVHDRLTGLFSRTKFDSAVETEIARAERQGGGFSLMLIDLDHFEEVNLQHGHQIGDEVLAELGRLISINTRKLVDACFRFGGDEFAVILIGADKKQSGTVAARILRAFRKSDKFGITLSVGITSFVSGEGKDALIARVDGAMYRAKQAGGNTVIDL